MTDTINPPAAVPAAPLTPGQALVELFLTNADQGYNAANDALVEELLTRLRAVTR